MTPVGLKRVTNQQAVSQILLADFRSMYRFKLVYRRDRIKYVILTSFICLINIMPPKNKLITDFGHVWQAI